MTGVWWVAAVFVGVWLAGIAYGLSFDVMRFFSSLRARRVAAAPEPESRVQIRTEEVTAEPVSPIPS